MNNLLIIRSILTQIVKTKKDVRYRIPTSFSEQDVYELIHLLKAHGCRVINEDLTILIISRW